MKPLPAALVFLNEERVMKHRTTVAALAVCLFSMVTTPGVAVARDADGVLGELAEAMKTPGHVDRKRGLLTEVANISSINALGAAVEATADKDVGKEAFAAAERIARALTAPDQPAYVRRSAFMRWVACQPEQQLATTLIDALRSNDIVLQSGAISTLAARHGGALLKSVLAEMASYPPDSRKSLLALLPAWGDASAIPVLLDLARKSGSGPERVIALQSIASLSPAAQSDADRGALLSALKLVTGSNEEEMSGDDSIAAAVQIAQTLVSTHADDAREALDTLSARNLSATAQQRVQGARLHFTVTGLSNLAKGAKASSPDGLDNEGGSSGDAAAIDGNEATYWDETDGHPLYKLRVDLPQATEVSAIAVTGWAHHNFSPKDFKILCDDKTVATVTAATYVNNRLIVALPRTQCASIELQITGYYGGSPAVRELEIYNAP